MAKDYIEDALKAMNVGATDLDQKTVAQINSMNIELKNADGSLAGRYTLSSFLENIIYTFLSTTKASPLASVLGALEHATVRDNTTSFDDLPEGSIRLIGTRNEGRPDGTEGSLLVCITFFKPTATSGGGLIQVAFKWLGASATAMTIYVRQTNGDGIFCPWYTLSLT